MVNTHGEGEGEEGRWMGGNYPLKMLGEREGIPPGIGGSKKKGRTRRGDNSPIK